MMRARWLWPALACLTLLVVVAACDPIEPESSDQTPAPRETQQVQSPAPTPEPTVVAELTEPPASPSISPTPSPDPVSPALTETPTPSLAPEPTTAVHLYIPTAGVDDATPTAAARAEPTPQDLLAERLRQFVQEGIRQEFPDAEAQPVHVFPLGLSDATGEFWGAVTDGPQPARITADDEAVNFFHFAAVYRLAEGDVWTEVDRLEIETAPQRTLVELTADGMGDCPTARRRRGSRSAAAPARMPERWTSSGLMARRSARSSHG